MNQKRVYLYHWVTEWTKAGRPHLHLAVFLSDPCHWLGLHIIRKWLSMTKHLGTVREAQYMSHINDMAGWGNYVAKHMGRGYGHYQRERESLPDGWKKTGAMWGKSKGWPTVEDGFDVDRSGWFALRRMIRRYLVAEAQRELSRAVRYGDIKRIAWLRKSRAFRRRMHTHGDRKKGEVQGLSEWVPYDITSRMIQHVAKRGPVSVVPVGERPLKPF
jgi:hypothetical protein